ncbi:TonB-dependent receptor plug domain-containing protein [Muriicola soli]|uniref:TonB-dependent receptor plug domain-containing protein n=1 Tax=Muriicola soli TaxID=2507538 RepID=A0A411EA57_9FLAO|nr:TonB-dependent receptor plug domain-containing protein [Muriicola soli]QBA64528.1 hypothetical protein EQY75_08320 [Muriicola soli]
MMRHKLIYRSLFLMAIGGLSLGCTSYRSTGVKGGPDTGNIRSVKAQKGETSILLMLQRVPGVTVRGNVVRVFGPNSFSNTSEPLFLIDGVAYSGGLSGILGSINPDDVRSIEVYKTPSELGAYGARGANGVINILLR